MARRPPAETEAEAPRARRRGPGLFTLVVALLIALVGGAAAWLEVSYRPPAPAAAPAVELALPADEPAPAAESAPAAEQAAAEPAEAAPPPPPPSAPSSAIAEAPAEAAPADEPPAAAEPAAPGPESAPAPPAPAEVAQATPSLAPAPPPPAEPEAAPQPEPERPAAVTTSDEAAEAWRANAQPFEPQPGRPRIAVVIWDLGLSPDPTRAAIEELPAEVTLGLAPYGADLQQWADRARAAGHEVVLQAPMEPERFPENDPGPHTLLTGLAPEENLERLEWVLDRFSGYVGVVSYLGARFTASPADLRPVLERLKQRGLLFLDSRAAPDSVADRLAGELGLAHAANTRFLDDEASRVAIEARLAELEKVAHESGWAVGIGYHYPVTMDRLAHWAKSLPAKGLQLAPLSAVVRQQDAGG